MKTFSIVAFLLLVGCNAEGRQEPAPRCEESTFPSEQLIKEFEINGIPMIYGFCTVDDAERDRLMEIDNNGLELLEGYDNVYRLGWGTNAEGIPLLMIRERNRNLYGVPQLRASLEVSSPLTLHSDLGAVVFISSADRFPLESSTFELMVANDSDEVISMGTDYSIEFFDGTDWIALPISPDWGFTLPLYILNPRETWNQTIWLDSHRSIVFDYVPGIYRIRKQIFLGDNSQTDLLHELTFQFELY